MKNLQNYLFIRVRFEKHLISVPKICITWLLTQLLFGAILGSSQASILQEASIFSWLPRAPCSSNCKLAPRCIILYILQSHSLHHKVIYSSLLTSPAHVPVSSSPYFYHIAPTQCYTLCLPQCSTLVLPLRRTKHNSGIKE